MRILRDFVVLILLMGIISCSPKTGSEIGDSAMDEAEAVETEPNTCGTFDDSRYGDDAITAHVLYRDYLKREQRSEEHTSELQSRGHLVCRLLLAKKINQR